MPSSAEQRRAAFPCELISWSRFAELSLRLGRTIRASGFQPDLIVAIGRGGYLPARMLSDYLNVFDLASIKIEHYQGTHRESLATVRYPLPTGIGGRQVLLVDDVSDSGDTFDVALRHLREYGDPQVLKSAVLHHKCVSNFVPDYYTEKVVEWRWIIYPWAVFEDLGGFISEMATPPASVDVLRDYLISQHGINVPEETLAEVLENSRGQAPEGHKGI